MPKPKFLYPAIVLLLCSLTVHADPFDGRNLDEAITWFFLILGANAATILYFISLAYLFGAGKRNNWWTYFLTAVITCTFIYFHFSVAMSDSPDLREGPIRVFYGNLKHNSTLALLISVMWMGFIVSAWRLIRGWLMSVKKNEQ